jgi:16S rRNA (uracil1498-N3)-methyltransferase
MRLAPLAAGSDNFRPMRRVFLPIVAVGEIDLPPSQAHHLRNVLRIGRGERIEVFNGQGTVAMGEIVQVTNERVTIRIEQINIAPNRGFYLTVAAALPKGPRADWMIEKLSEIGVDVLVPLITQRSVVVPGNTRKQDRWARLAEQAARQARRSDVMRIESPAELPALLANPVGRTGQTWYLSPDQSHTMLQRVTALPGALMILVGPEGGWTDGEKLAFEASGAVGVRLTQNVLRVETAAVVAAGIVLSALTAAQPPATIHQPGRRKPA